MNKEETKENKITEEFEEDSIENLDEKPVEPLEEGEDKKVTEDLIKEIEVKETKENWRKIREREREEAALKSWIPKTELGKEVKAGKIKDIDEILDKGKKILEAEIVDSLIKVKTDLISIGQSKGKFGGGKRRAWRQTQRKTKEGNIPTFSAFAVVGDENGHVGIGTGRATETLPARDKAIRKAKLNIFKVVRGDGSFDSVGGGETSIPFKVKGKSGSVRITLMPAAPGTGLVVGNELKKILKLAGIKDIYSKTSGRLRTTFNLIKACIDALKKTNKESQK
ncbi:30S ribosomal protein S5 [Candidatus Pacearchaeota archaeon]|nr:MAG: 30S ribosomal protein S5 [Candidatus Pacearchaeota archaeon]